MCCMQTCVNAAATDRNIHPHSIVAFETSFTQKNAQEAHVICDHAIRACRIRRNFAKELPQLDTQPRCTYGRKRGLCVRLFWCRDCCCPRTR